MSGEAPICAGCGRRADGEAVPWTWTTSTDDDGRRQVLCDQCVRQHARSIEAKLDAEWW